MHVAQAVDIMIVQAKIIDILLIKVHNLASVFITVSSNRNRKHIVQYVSLLSHTCTIETLVFPQHFSFSQTSSCVSSI